MSKINLIPNFGLGTFEADERGLILENKKTQKKEGQTVSGFFFKWFGVLCFVGKSNFKINRPAKK